MYASYESSIAIPNLLVFNPVDIYGWVLGSMSGLTRIEIFALTPTSFETLLIATSSSNDSTLKKHIPKSSAFLISKSDFATPEKTTFFGLAPIFIILSSSPSETISKPEPRLLKTFNIERLELALTE